MMTPMTLLPSGVIRDYSGDALSVSRRRLISIINYGLKKEVNLPDT